MFCFACFAVVERIGRSMERASSSTTCSHKIHKKSASQNGRSWSSYTCSCWWRWNHCACRYQCYWDRLSLWLLSLKGETNMYPFLNIFHKSLCCWLWWATFCSKKIHLFAINWFYIYSALRGLFCSGVYWCMFYICRLADIASYFWPVEIVPRVQYSTTILVGKKCFEAKYNFSKDKTKKMLQGYLRGL